MPFPAIRYVMNMLNGFIWDAAVLIAIYHVWGWVPLFWTALILGTMQTIALGYMAEAALGKKPQRAEG